MCWFCKHKYKILKVVEVYEDGFSHWLRTNDFTNKLPIYHKYVLQCVKCGKLKTKKV